ncbi:MAG: DUF72 domain-containing protein [Acidimicrobiales bacterium]
MVVGNNHLDRVQQLGAHVGPNLLQLPPRWKRNVERLDDFLTVAPDTIRWAVEVRDPSWLHEETYEVLRRHGAALCVHDLLPGHPVERTTDWTYWRFHGPNAIAEPYQHRYGPDRLAGVAARLRAWLDEGTDVYAYLQQRLALQRRRRRGVAATGTRRTCSEAQHGLIRRATSQMCT